MCLSKSADCVKYSIHHNSPKCFQSMSQSKFTDSEYLPINNHEVHNNNKKSEKTCGTVNY